MKRGLGARGYTLLEVMIVMAVSGGLLVAAMTMISGQRSRTEFSQAIREIDSQIQDVINDVSTGYYANTGNFSCELSGDRPVLAQVEGDSQGSNKDCTFIGRVMQFGVADSNNEKFNIFNVVGLRQVLSNGAYVNASSLAQAVPTAMAPTTSNPNVPDSTDKRQLQYGLSLVSMKVDNRDIGAFGFFSSLVPVNSSGTNLLSGAQTVQLVPIPGSSLGATGLAMAGTINAMGSSTLEVNPTKGVVLCFQSGGTDQYGVITIGSNGRRLSTTTQIKSRSCT